MSADHISFEDRNVSWKENDRIQFDNNHIIRMICCPSKLSAGSPLKLIPSCLKIRKCLVNVRQGPGNMIIFFVV